MLEADENIIISGPIISGTKAYELIRLLKDKQISGVEITIVTWNLGSYRFKDAGYWLEDSVMRFQSIDIANELMESTFEKDAN